MDLRCTVYPEFISGQYVHLQNMYLAFLMHEIIRFGKKFPNDILMKGLRRKERYYKIPQLVPAKKHSGH